MSMDPPPKPTTSLFEVYLRLRPSFAPNAERFLDVVEPNDKHAPTHITIHPPTHDQRKRAVETFTFTKVFEEEAAQLELFNGTGLGPMIQGVLGPEGREGRDGLIATLGVTGSGKSHTILGSRSQRGLTQLALDVLYQSLADRLVSARRDPLALQSLLSSDNSESHIMAANQYLEGVYGDSTPETRSHSRAQSRAATPLMDVSFMSGARPSSAMQFRRHMPRVSTMPQFPIVQGIELDVDDTAEFAIVVSMYEVYNDRIYDLLAGTASQQVAKNSTVKRRHLLYKSTEQSPDRKVVAGLRKVVCENLDEALLVLETGLTERKVAGTGSNAVSSRSHGFFCVEVKKRHAGAAMGPWSSSTLTVVDLAGSERARAAKTAGSTLAEAGKINESLMYLGQCMQMQSDNTDMSKPQNIVPFRQCKLTELLFSNSFPSSSNSSHHNAPNRNKPPQKAIMIVTADPLGDYNATSQILRYSALAREVSVPRVPSLTSTIMPLPTPHARPGTAASGRMTPSGRVTPSGRMTPSMQQASDDLEQALRDLALAREDLEITQIRLEEETQRRREAESSWLATEQRLEAFEAELREEIWEEMEEQLESERRRWQAARDAEAEHNEAHLDRKLEILTRTLGDVKVHEDPEPSLEEKMQLLEAENAALREQLQAMHREKQNTSPVRKMRVLKPRKWEGKEEFGVGLLGGSP